MKKQIFTGLAVLALVSAQADGRRWDGGYRGHWEGRGHYGRSGFRFYYGAGYPCYAPFYTDTYYPAYGYYPYYEYSRPNYAVSGTLSGALVGGLIGNSIHHQGWEGAGIGAAAGLLLGSLAERDARAYERAYAPLPGRYAIADASGINPAPTVPDAPRIPDPNAAVTYRPAGTMGGANSLFGR